MKRHIVPKCGEEVEHPGEDFPMPRWLQPREPRPMYKIDRMKHRTPNGGNPGGPPRNKGRE